MDADERKWGGGEAAERGLMDEDCLPPASLENTEGTEKSEEESQTRQTGASVSSNGPHCWLMRAGDWGDQVSTAFAAPRRRTVLPRRFLLRVCRALVPGKKRRWSTVLRLGRIRGGKNSPHVATSSVLLPRALMAQAPVGAVRMMLRTATARISSPGAVSMPAACMASRGAEPMAAWTVALGE